MVDNLQCMLSQIPVTDGSGMARSLTGIAATTDDFGLGNEPQTRRGVTSTPNSEYLRPTVIFAKRQKSQKMELC